MSRFLPPSKIMQADVVRSIIGDGCVIKSGSVIKNSVVGLRSLIDEDCVIEDSLIMGSDYFETLEECENVPGQHAQSGFYWFVGPGCCITALNS